MSVTESVAGPACRIFLRRGHALMHVTHRAQIQRRDSMRRAQHLPTPAHKQQEYGDRHYGMQPAISRRTRISLGSPRSGLAHQGRHPSFHPTTKHVTSEVLHSTLTSHTAQYAATLKNVRSAHLLWRESKRARRPASWNHLGGGGLWRPHEEGTLASTLLHEARWRDCQHNTL